MLSGGGAVSHSRGLTVTYSPSLNVGQEPIPGYHLRRRLGTGGFGTVWEAAGPQGERIALKFLSAHARQAAAREIRALQALRHLNHPHLLVMHEVWCLNEYIVIAMELADGSLADLLDVYLTDYRVPIPADHVCQYLTQAAKALDFLNTRRHEVNGIRVAVQHCDVKPNNLLLVGENVKVADFGLSGWVTASTKLVRPAGTLDFCAPEVFQGVLTRQIDQYALAVTYCLLRGGRVPFPDTPANFQADYTRPKPDLTMLSEREQPLVARALEHYPHYRWPSCGDLMFELSKVVR